MEIAKMPPLDEAPDVSAWTPEWLGLAPRLERFWRRRRLARWRLMDPDYSSAAGWTDERRS